jgi:ectoine hydroxylase-related dioxygenase (phytanoyl-CoA dioxygenase family)
MLVIPGSHRRNSLPQPAPGERVRQPAGAMPVLARRGDALIFDRRLWHSRSDNLSPITRKAIFCAYTYRWIRPRDELGIGPGDPRFDLASPIRRQLLGDGEGPRSHWALNGEPQPLRDELDRLRLLDPALPSHR